MSPLAITHTVTLPADELRWTAVRASGPGGQNVNKVASKVELRFDLGRTAVLDDGTRERLRQIAGNRIDGEGVLLVVAQETRDQPRNLELAREKLAALVRQALVRPKPRRATRPSRGAKERRLATKKHEGAKKRERSGRVDDRS